jgi:hypothetical protein
MKRATKKTASMRPRGPFAHADDYREALLELANVLKASSPEAAHWARFGAGPHLERPSELCASGLLHMADEMIEAGQRLRRACRRLLVAQHGRREARRHVGWKPRRRAA